VGDSGPSKGVDEKEEEDGAEFALSLAEDWTANLKDLKLVFQHSHRENYLIFSLRVCIANDPVAITVQAYNHRPPATVLAQAAGSRSNNSMLPAGDFCTVPQVRYDRILGVPPAECVLPAA